MRAMRCTLRVQGNPVVASGTRMLNDPAPSIASLTSAIRGGSTTPEALVTAALEEIARLNPEINAFIQVIADRAQTRARVISTYAPDSLPLYGIPFAVKDVVDLAGLPTTCQSRIRPIKSATADAWIVTHLEAAGAICLGKLALGEFSLGPDSRNPEFSAVMNPIERSWTTGSTSTGSAAAVASGMIPFSIGSDTGGSIRNPAMMTRTVGLKPTTGLIPLAGTFPLAPSMDTIGPFTRTVEDMMVVYDALMLGHNRPTCEPIDDSVKPLQIGYARHLHADDSEPSTEVVRTLDDVAYQLGSRGHDIKEISLPHLTRFAECGWTILLFEAAAIHREWMERHPDAYHPETLTQLSNGSRVSLDAYQKALQERRELAHAVDHAFQSCNVVFCAVSGYPGCRRDDSVGLELIDASSVRIPFNVSGHPAVALPGPLTQNGFPVGMQLVGRRGADRQLLQDAISISNDLSRNDLVQRSTQ